MREIKVKVNFEKGTIQKESAKIVSGDYNSTKLVFEFDREDGKKTLEMNDTEDNLLYNGEILNNEVILVGEDEDGNPCSLFAEEGTYPFEVVLYDGESKLTAVGGKLKITAETVAISDTIVTPQLPVFDQLLGQVSTALNNCEEAVEDIYNAEEEAQGIISDFESNVGDYTAAFNANASSKTQDFNTNASTKTQAVNQIYEDTQDLVDGFDTKVTQAKNELNGIVSDAQEVYDDFETNAAAKTTAFNDNAASKTETFNTNASEKTSAFNTNAAAKTAYFDSHADSIEKELASLKTTRNAIPKVSGKGTEITLDKTAEATFDKFGLMGNCEQESTTGKQLFNKASNIFSHNNCSVTYSNGIYSLTPNAGVTYYELTLELVLSPGNYILNSDSVLTSVSSIIIRDESFNELISLNNYSNKSFTISSTSKYIRFNLSTSSSTNLDLNTLMISATGGDYEPYTGGIASPNPDYPQDIHVVSGDNVLKVQNKNLISISNGTYTKNGVTAVVENGKITLNGTASGTSFLEIPFVCEYDGSTYCISANNEKTIGSSTDSGNYASLRIAGEGISQAYLGNQKASKSFVLNGTYNNITIRTGSGLAYNNFILYPQLEKSPQATSYEPHKEQIKHITLPNGMELAGIGDYRDELRRSTGKNLYDKSQEIENTIINSAGTTGTSNDYNASDYLQFTPITQITLSTDSTSTLIISEYDNTKKFIRRNIKTNATSYTITTNQDTKYLRLCYFNSVSQVMLEKDSQATDYEPYGVGVWYKYGAAGKAVLDGSENWITQAQTGYYRYGATISSILNSTSLANNVAVLSNNFRGISFNNRGEDYLETIYIVSNGLTSHEFYINTLKLESLNDFKLWLSNNPVTMYYVLATPTYETITDTTLISQLDDIYYTMKSYKGQTNISQTPNDAPFYLDAEALYDLEDLLTRVSALEG